MLRYLVDHRDRFAFLSRDSSRSLRESTVFQRLVERSDLLIPALLALVLFYLFSVALLATGAIYLGPMSALLFAAGVAFLFFTNDPGHDFLLSMLFLAALMITFTAERSLDRLFLLGLTLGDLSRLIFALAGVLVAAKLILRRPDEFFLSTSDFLVLGLAVFLGLALPQLEVVPIVRTGWRRG